MRPGMRGTALGGAVSRRTVILGALSATLVVASLSGLAPPGFAQEGAPAEPFNNGVGKASAGVLNIAPRAGQVSLGFTSGIAVAQFRNSLAEAQAQTADTGILGDSLFAGSSCPSSLPDLPSLPSSERPDTPTRVDSNDGDVDLVEERAPIGVPGFGAGRQHAQAQQIPRAFAESTPAGFEVPGLVKLGGGTATAESGVIDDVSRQARAVAQASITIADTVTLSGMRWEAVHRTGAEPAKTGRFDIGHLTILGQEVPVPSDAAAAEMINAALAPVGLRVELPEVIELTEPNDVVIVTPMRIQLKDSEPLRVGVGGLLNASRTFREQVFNELAKDCQTSSVALLGDLGLLIAGGNGSIALDVGGADATTADVKTVNPFGTAPVLPPVASVVQPPTPARAGTPSVVSRPTEQVTSGVTPAAAIVDYEESCESTHERRWPACSTGAALPVGVAGLLGTAVLGTLDWRRQRRLAEVTP
jgi:hypothetical protein